MYRPPTQEGIARAISDGISYDDARKGYFIVVKSDVNAECIERIDSCYVDFGMDDVTDEDCAREAERNGECKIISTNELPVNFPYNEYVWIDTPENREKINEFCNTRHRLTSSIKDLISPIYSISDSIYVSSNEITIPADTVFYNAPSASISTGIINANEMARDIEDVFDEFLERRHIYIPNDYRVGDTGEACIFGDDYDELIREIKDKLIYWLDNYHISFEY